MRTQIRQKAFHHFPELWKRYAKPSAREKYHVDGSRYFIDITDPRANRRIRISRSNAIFTIDMLNSFDYYFGAVKPFKQQIGKATFAVVDFSTPRFHEIKGFEDFPILCPTIAEPFVTVEQYTNFAELRAGDIVLDLGAYSGLTAICFSKLVGKTGHVICVEPDPKSFEAAEVNVEQHKKVNFLENITIMNNAAGSTKKTIKFSAEGTLGSADISIVGLGRGQTIDVACLTLDDIVIAHNLRKVDFLKIDIEGSEVDVLSGSENFFSHFRPRILVEPHYVAGTVTTNSVCSLLESLKYKLEIIEQTGVDLPLILGEPL